MVFVPLIIAFQCILLVHKVSGSISKIQDKESDEENTDKTNKTDKKGGSFNIKEQTKLMSAVLLALFDKTYCCCG